ncbi:hypothetical protein HK104_009162 [Borealophlyctis nickersoniae]|nr:hypothetical protein HK104_009162 [Borealophlyctis nickersoniae]
MMDSNTTHGLLRLSDELIALVFIAMTYPAWNDLRTASRDCRRWRAILSSKNTPLWRQLLIAHFDFSPINTRRGAFLPVQQDLPLPRRQSSCFILGRRVRYLELWTKGLQKVGASEGDAPMHERSDVPGAKMGAEDDDDTDAEDDDTSAEDDDTSAVDDDTSAVDDDTDGEDDDTSAVHDDDDDNDLLFHYRPSQFSWLHQCQLEGNSTAHFKSNQDPYTLYADLTYMAHLARWLESEDKSSYVSGTFGYMYPFILDLPVIKADEARDAVAVKVLEAFGFHPYFFEYLKDYVVPRVAPYVDCVGGVEEDGGEATGSRDGNGDSDSDSDGDGDDREEEDKQEKEEDEPFRISISDLKYRQTQAPQEGDNNRLATTRVERYETLAEKRETLQRYIDECS